MTFENSMGSKLLCLMALVVLGSLASCKKEGKDKPIPDISMVPEQLQLLRADVILQNQDLESFRSDWESLYRQHPMFSVFYRDQLLQLPPDAEDSIESMFEIYANAKIMRELADDIDSVHASPVSWEEELAEAFRFHKYYFPEDPLPPVYTFSGTFGSPIEFTPHFAAIALTMFMGRDFAPYKSFPSEQLPHYLLHRLEPERLPIEMMSVIARDKWYMANPTAKVLDLMIQEGKYLYYLESVLPRKADSLIIGFTSNQMDWVEFNQEDAWALMVTEELLFSGRAADISRMLGEGPHTKGMSVESPARVAVWIGWQIVRAYMERNPKLDMEQMFAITDGQYILEESRWKPRKKVD